jgi:hypothetical protein
VGWRHQQRGCKDVASNGRENDCKNKTKGRIELHRKLLRIGLD